MPDSAGLLDEYALRARVAPVLAVIVIPVSGLICWFPAFSISQLALGATLSMVLLAIFSQIGRDQGRVLQPHLYKCWGGQPSVQLLRWKSQLLSKETRARYGQRLESASPGLRLPSEIDELVDPDDADRRYDTVCLFLRDSTRNKSAFPLVFAENVNYGFRRNLLAMKPAGILLSIVGVISSVLATIVGNHGNEFDPPPVPIATAILNAAMLTWWCFRINSNWVRVAAFAYAERLLGSCDSLSASQAATTKTSKE
jgi:hypothetical protein